MLVASQLLMSLIFVGLALWGLFCLAIPSFWDMDINILPMEFINIRNRQLKQSPRGFFCIELVFVTMCNAKTVAVLWAQVGIAFHKSIFIKLKLKWI